MRKPLKDKRQTPLEKVQNEQYMENKSFIPNPIEIYEKCIKCGNLSLICEDHMCTDCYVRKIRTSPEYPDAWKNNSSGYGFK
jgi:hypothetical protein